MDDNKNGAILLEEVHSSIDMLQKAIAKVGKVKASLKTTASDMKSQIRDSVSRHLEAMRNRETWLLGQVEVVQHIKEDVLRQQQAELNKALGRLQSTCALLEQSGKAFDTESLECRVRESLEDVGDLNLNPSETNAIGFVAQNFELQKSIHKFGGVVCDHPLIDKKLVSSYEKLKLHSGKKLAFFTPSGRSEDWLMKQSPDNSSQDGSKISTSNFSVQDWLKPQAPPAGRSTELPIISMPQNSSIEHWLAKSQSQSAAMETDMETEASKNKKNVENKDVVTSARMTRAEIQGWLLQSEKATAASAVPPSSLFEYFKDVNISDSNMWLKKPCGSVKEELSTDLIGDTYRKIAASSPYKWLKRKSPSTPSSKFSRSISTQSCSECSCGMASMCSYTDAQEKSMEFDDSISDMSDGLAVRKDVEISSGVTASSLDLSMEVPDNDRWLLKQSDYCESSVTTNDSTGIKNYKENLAAQSSQCWLLCQDPDNPENKKVDDREIESGMKSYIESLPVDHNQWLLNRPTDSSICKWLARSSSERCKDCPRMCSKGLFKVFDQVASSKDGWLKLPELY